MNADQINPTGFHSSDWPTQSARSSRPMPARTAADANFGVAQDRVDLSAAAESRDTTVQAAATSQRIREIRAQLAAGTYLTSDKIDAAVERLHEELFGQ